MNRRGPAAGMSSVVCLTAVGCLALLPPAASAAPAGCLTGSTSDFNGDGYDDAAVGDPYATVNGQVGAGAVTVLFGDADGRIGAGPRKLITQASFGETPEAGDHFGWDVYLAPADLGSDCAQLLVGSPGEDVGSAKNAGTAHLISDLPASEGTPDLDVFRLTQAGAGGVVESGDEFGSAVVISGPLQEDGRWLVVGAPGESAGATADAGAVNIWNIDRTPVGLTELRQGRSAPHGTVRVPGTPQQGDRFGASVVVGAVNLASQVGDDVGQGLIIGAPGDAVSGHDDAGSVTVLQEAFQSTWRITQDSAGVPGAPSNGDRFGSSLALSPRSQAHAATLAVGAPGEDASGLADTGSVTLFSNASQRFVPRTRFSQATPGVPGTIEARDRFGYSLAFGLRTPTLLVGVPTEDIGSIANAGVVQPVQVPSTTLPLSFRSVITENAAGTAYAVGAGHQFGRSVGALSGRSENIVTISSVFAGSGSVYVISDNTAIVPRSWASTSGAGRFGWSVAN